MIFWECPKCGGVPGVTFCCSDKVGTPPPAPPPQWQPIETAPKHTEVLVWREDSGPFIAKLTDPYEVITVEEMERENMEFPDDFEEWYSDAYGWQEGSEKPTHWMPLPTPPLPGPASQT